MANMVGAGWLDVKNHLLNAYGPDSIDRVKAAISPQDREALFSKPILAFSWLDYGAYIRFLLTAEKILGAGDNLLIKNAQIQLAQKNFSGIFKFLISLTSPAFIVKNAGLIWKKYFDSGILKLEKSDAHSATLQLTNFPDIPLQHDLIQNFYFNEALTLSGAKNAKTTHPKCIARGDAFCRFVCTWD